MKLLTLLLICVLLLCTRLVVAQTDSAAVKTLVPMRTLDRHTSTKAYRMTFIAAPLVVGGVVMMSYDRDFRQLRNGYAESFKQSYDDYLQYAPMALTYGMKVCGYTSRNSWGRMVVSNIFSAGLMAGAVNTLKYSISIQRPDGSSYNSFPSGHTATAFMAATILHKEYGDRSPWFSILGYTMATVTGITRQLNNRHWMSDVMVGAGIGILSAELGYFLADLIYKDRGRNFNSNPDVAFDRYQKPSFFGLNVGFSTILGRYTPYSDMDLSFVTGPTVSVQGAWFATPYIGVGARLSCSSLHVKINGEAQDEGFESSSAFGGLFVSYPVSARWLLGSKLMGGFEHYKAYDTSFGRLGGKGGGAFGTGVSMTYLASHNLGVRFTTDYDLLSPVTRQSSEWMHRLTFGLEVAAVF